MRWTVKTRYMRWTARISLKSVNAVDCENSMDCENSVDAVDCENSDDVVDCHENSVYAVDSEN